MTTTQHDDSKGLPQILVTGGTGKTGSRVAERLRAAGLPVRIGSRRAEIPFDWEDPATWDAALAGVQAAYVAYQPDLAVPGALATVTAFFDRALAAGVRRLVLLTGRGENEALEAEQALQALTGRVEWTILRASWFFQNFDEGFFLEAIRGGEIAIPVGPVAEPFVDVEDIADIAFAALTGPGHGGKVYEITGPEALTFAEVAATFSAGLGREVRFTWIPAEHFSAGMQQAGVPEETVELILYLFGTVLDGRNTPLADGVQLALGRKPRRFADYVRRTAATGVWGGAS
ncbi:MAG: putative nucleoside-diphosphate sugar epimerase [Akkermansiaceae bacterium]|nr:putative nucleoside-diphosphate sugar epimerase [Akkermansiaceae bacterium]